MSKRKPQSKASTIETPPSGGRGASLHSSLPLQGVGGLVAELSSSLKRPTARTLRLIDRALAWLQPFESPKAMTSSIQEKRELLSLLTAHRLLLSPYIDVDSIESHLRR